ncbi:MAG: hypothetical protein A2015_14085 [Spirochaetes bacterium GWF1_31_7]|nr:MAG: hypothetical protein A2Y30_03665 [Spirochaetes bacterium GWE1_32_154]OHD45236.1 MAG: hypothetical protein A2Y29_02275 [Spirochaetes bacterium GWE2_31_10]OHD50531.1 MAG: hypothetical protein A2015_14085 [Spirochaetes bacterium GWF1_31_7]OHD79144.1 MAG: hypothetical protein A2355_11005 [Spirochaetes bacterium RIFOXYB1_FULL_32_8]HBD94181.1 hypothetical protein [Spirochaetia bacterium]
MSRKVLILDDDYSFACNVINNNATGNMSFSVADSLNRARMMMKNESYDLILANTKVPGGSSYSLKDELSSHSPATRMIFMSALDKEFEAISSLGERCIRKNEIYNKESNIFEK